MCPMAGRISKWDNRLGPRRQGGSAVDFGAGYLESHSTMATEKKHIFIFFRDGYGFGYSQLFESIFGIFVMYFFSLLIHL